MNTNNPLITWVQEMFLRLTSKSPKFFKIWKIILGIPVLIIALPNALQILNIHLPQVFSAKIQDIVGWATTAALFMSFLPTQSTPVAVDQKGTPIKQTDKDKLPFTSAEEKKEMLKEDAKPDTPPVQQVILPEVDTK